MSIAIDLIKKNLLHNRFINFSAFKTDLFVKKIASQVERNSKIIDIGAGSCPYKKYFKEARYVSQDFCEEIEEAQDFSQIDLKSDAQSLPIEDDSFDYILCTSVLEHLKYPQKAFREFARILKKGGRVFLVVPLIIGEHHEPFDYFRFTKYGLELLAEESGLKIIQIKRQGGFFIFLSQTMTGLPHFYTKNKELEKFLFIILYPVNFIFSFICYFLDKIDRTKNVFCYECIFEKK